MTTLNIETCSSLDVSDEKLHCDRNALSDVDLVGQFVSSQDADAFESLMRRHAPMVMGVCRRILANAQDAEDACQATFLLLVEKSASIRRPEQLANWLFGVAHRIASRLRVRAARRRSSEMTLPDAVPEVWVDDSTGDVMRREVLAVLDTEIRLLPEKHRLPLILCYLQNKTHTEAAKELGCPSGSMSTRLSQARESLRRRLARRGIVLTASWLATFFLRESFAADVSDRLIGYTSRAATLTLSGKAKVSQVVSNAVAEAVEDMNQVLFVSGVKRIATALLAVVLVLAVTDQAVAISRSQPDRSLAVRSFTQVRTTVRTFLGNMFTRQQDLPVIHSVVRSTSEAELTALEGCGSKRQKN